ncbi:hypothetical protein D9M69_710620 [compost metagenome]
MKSCLPAAVTLTVALLPAASRPVSKEPSSAVAVWRLESPLVKVIVSPVATASLAGLNFMPLIWTA